ncbi:DUF4352 domain-containing protein [Virgibacillus byunsanensis]|uniref:DUF4352 domain-containing protein n=1 Tax=Virgibacillus byunsanensis TaxID=570945 RepID=A0ABW3LPH9_9BACI
MTIFLKILGISLLAVGFLIGCSPEETGEQDDTEQEVENTEDVQDDQENDEENNQEKEQQGNNVAQAGEPLDINGVKVTVSEAQLFEGEINQFEPLEEDHAVFFDVTIDNTTDEQVFISDMDFKLYGVDEFELGRALPSDEMALSAEVNAGKKARGKLFFDVPQQDGNWEIHYEDIASFGGDPAIWEMSAK